MLPSLVGGEVQAVGRRQTMAVLITPDPTGRIPCGSNFSPWSSYGMRLRTTCYSRILPQDLEAARVRLETGAQTMGSVEYADLSARDDRQGVCL
jgi:hypothetical protein